MGIGLDQYYKIEGFFQHSSVFGNYRNNFYGYGKIYIFVIQKLEV